MRKNTFVSVNRSLLILVVLVFALLALNLTLIETGSGGNIFFSSSDKFVSPHIINSSADPYKVYPGDTLTFSAKILDIFGLEKVQAKIEHEKGYDIIDLKLISGTKKFGIWEGKWIVHNTKVKEYQTEIIAYSKSGFNSSSIVSWFDPIVDPWWDTDWSYRKKITINSSQVSDDLTNFPVLISITDEDLSTKAQSNGDDIAFTDNAGIQLNHEIEKYDNGTGELVAWVNVTNLDSSEDTEIYMYYSNSMCDNQENPTAVWDDNYVLVMHFSETSGDYLDSTLNSNDAPLGSINVDSRSTNGIIGFAPDFERSDSDYIEIPDDSTLDIDLFTIESWVNIENVMDWQTITAKGSSNDVFNWYLPFDDNGDHSEMEVHLRTGYDTGETTVTDFLFNSGEWNYVVGRLGDDGYLDVLKDGDECSYATHANPGGADQNNDPVRLGDNEVWGSEHLDGIIDEFRISKIPRSDDWIRTCYNTVYNSDVFFTLGCEEVATPEKPVLDSVNGNNFTNNDKPIFSWSECDNTDNYTLYVDHESDFSSEDAWSVIKVGKTNTTHTVNETKKLSQEGTWYWQVVANNSNDENISDLGSFIYDKTGPNASSLSSPVDNFNTTNNQVTFSWNPADDNKTNTSEVSNICSYELWVDDNPGFTSPTLLYNSSSNFSQQTVEGIVYWRVRGWDNSGNSGSWSEIRQLNVFDFSLTLSSNTFQLLKGETQSVTLNVSKLYSGSENEEVNLSYEWIGTAPSGVTVSFGSLSVNGSNETFVDFVVGENATTGTYYCRFTGTWEGFNRYEHANLTSSGMLFSLDAYPQTIFLKRDDEKTSTISVDFDLGALEDVSLSGSWIGADPSGAYAELDVESGTPSFESTLTFTTTSIAEQGGFVYSVTASGSGLSKTKYFQVNIDTNLTLNVATDKTSYERGERIYFSGTVRDYDNNIVSGGTVTIQLSSDKWSKSFSTSISNGEYDTDYYIESNNPGGTWTVYVSVEDNNGNIGSTYSTRAVNVETFFEKLTISTSSEDTNFEKGEFLNLNGVVKDPSGDDVAKGVVTIQIEANNWNTHFTTNITDGEYQTQYYIPFDKPMGEWIISANATDQYGNTGNTWTPKLTDAEGGNITITVSIPETKDNYNIEITNLVKGETFSRGEEINFYLNIKDKNGNNIDDLTVTTIAPSGKKITFIAESPSGEYSASHKFKYNTMTGEYTFNIKAEKWEDGEYKTGFKKITVKIQPAEIIIVIDEENLNQLTIGETIQIKITATYPDGTPVTKEKITAYTPNGQQLIFIKSTKNNGEYTSSYTPNKEDLGNWTLQINMQDAYGNTQTKTLNLKINEPPEKTPPNPLIKYWYITIIIALIIAGIVSREGLKKYRKNKLKNIKIETNQLEKLKKEKAIAYFSEAEITRENYDKMLSKYESKLSNLSKKKRMLEKKLKQNNKASER